MKEISKEGIQILLNQNFSLRQIAKKFGVQLYTIRYHLNHGEHLNRAKQKRRDRGARPYKCRLCKKFDHNSQTCGVARP